MCPTQRDRKTDHLSVAVGCIHTVRCALKYTFAALCKVCTLVCLLFPLSSLFFVGSVGYYNSVTQAVYNNVQYLQVIITCRYITLFARSIPSIILLSASSSHRRRFPWRLSPTIGCPGWAPPTRLHPAWLFHWWLTLTAYTLDLVIYMQLTTDSVLSHWLLMLHCCQIPLVVIDSYYYGGLVIAPFNIFIYNVFTEHGPNIYGKQVAV